MNRGHLAIGAGVVVVAAFAIYVFVASREEAPAPRPGEPVAHAATRAADSGNAASGNRTVRPVAPGDAPATRPSREYTVGDVRVRDHRTGDHPPLDLPPAVHRPDGRKIPSVLTHEISQRVRAVVNTCAASVPPEARGATPTADGELRLAIKEHQVIVTSATFQLRDVVGAALDPIKACIEQQAIGVSVPSGDEPDVENYSLTVSLRIPASAR